MRERNRSPRRPMAETQSRKMREKARQGAFLGDGGKYKYKFIERERTIPACRDIQKLRVFGNYAAVTD